jgi:DNA-binding NtrC family response regulator
VAKILVVDDDRDILELVRSVLEPAHHVLVAEGGADALAVLAREQVDLLVTDVRMPGMSGFALINEAKTRQPHLNVIVMSAYIDDTDEMAGQVLRRYTDIALCKPLHVRQFADLVSAALAS